MASTNKTTNLELSQYIGTDKPTYLIDYNSDMLKIDTAVGTNTTNITGNTTNIGTLSSLTTTDKTDLVSAINEVDGNCDTNAGNISTLNTQVGANTGNIGTMANLNTTEKTNLVGAVNEVNSKTGTLSNLTTITQTNLVSAVNEVNESTVYATTEKQVGTWLGKPLYRTVIVLPNGTGSQTAVNYTLADYGIADVDEIFIVHPSYYTLYNPYSHETSVFPFNYYDGSKYGAEVKNGETLIITLGYNYIMNNRTVVTLEYTKTTDVI